MSARARIEATAIGLALALFMLGVSVLLLTFPGVTGTLVRAFGSAGRSGLAEETAARLAQDVRTYVADGTRPQLPATVDGRPGFTPRAVAHLDDVRAVFSGTRLATTGLAALLTAWLMMRLSRRSYRPIAAASKTGAFMLFTALPLAAVAAVLDFDVLFAWFHALFFEGDTWLFPADELLIQLFPEPFWVTAGALWAALAFLGGTGLYAASRALAREDTKATRRPCA